MPSPDILFCTFELVDFQEPAHRPEVIKPVTPPECSQSSSVPPHPLFADLIKSTPNPPVMKTFVLFLLLAVLVALSTAFGLRQPQEQFADYPLYRPFLID
ncbi:hypothetical protein QR680_018420 [Steinernema hermaphroditum]|uniref:Uncharacterized protein n=1 Tax=Steinernema hermaphroditum TaxID=289476 RepID=A0AA39LQA9_9BILA|nr:hypothetical protein QR680_018420 [Steinernema hermaphroditum]